MSEIKSGEPSNASQTPKASQMPKTSRKRRVFRIIAAIAVAAAAAELIRSNYVIETERIVIQSSDIPAGFDGTVIVQISDYHNHGGSYCERLLDRIKQQSPDYIFITGDTADRGLTDIDAANDFLEGASEIAPCYLVWGNHENALEDTDRERMVQCCRENGITVLDSETVYITRGGDSILLTGTSGSLSDGRTDEMMKDYPYADFSIWLHHFPEDFHQIADMSEEAGCRADLIFAGHAHGGLIGIPFLGGLYAPGQGLFPEYTSGKYTYGDSVMVVSRGVGNSGYSRRFADSFHLVTVELKCAEHAASGDPDKA